MHLRGDYPQVFETLGAWYARALSESCNIAILGNFEIIYLDRVVLSGRHQLSYINDIVITLLLIRAKFGTFHTKHNDWSEPCTAQSWLIRRHD